MSKKTIAVLGGTGNLGHALAWRWARAGYPVIIGSRTAEKAAAAAAQINARTGLQSATGTDNRAAVASAAIVVLAVPYAAHRDTLETVLPALSGQIVVDTTVPLRPPKVSTVQLPAEGSAAVQTQACVAGRARVAAAFHNVAAGLLDTEAEIHCDVLVTADDVEARKEVMQLAEDAGCHALNAGVLANAAASEALTSVLIHINKTYKSGHAGIRITGL
jgi:NADPH-dependent F420 reductase